MRIRFRTAFKFSIFGCCLGVTLFLIVIYEKGTEDQNYFFHKYNCYTNIFFTETSGFAESLNARQACSVESAARHNIYANVQVWIFTNRSVIDAFRLKRVYPNINIIRSNFGNFFEDTLLKKWYRDGSWKKSPYRVSHLSDSVRYNLISIFGGIYLDLDAIVLKPLCGLRNFIVKESSDVLCSGIFGLDVNHQLLLHCLKRFSKSYNKDCFNCVGPALMTETFKEFCNLTDLRKAENCSNLSVLPEITAFPLSFYEWKDYFRKSKADYVIRKVKKSYIAHLFNTFSTKRKLYLGSGCPYEEIMKVNCPIVYEHVLRTSRTV